MLEIFKEYLLHPFFHTLEHSLYMLPVLFIVYILIELIEHKAMDKLRAVFASKRFGIVGASLLGLFPQCGFSVAASNLYSERLIRAGVLTAVFIATSDEALPIIASSVDSAAWFLPLVAIKFLWAIVVGMLTDLIFRISGLDKGSTKPHAEHEHAHEAEHHHEPGHHHHCADCDSDRGIFASALKRTVSIFLFIVIIGFALNFAVELLGEDKLSRIIMTDSIFQPFLTALVGLIPSCISSVLLSNLFVSGAIGFGSLAAGLSSGAGLGMLVLFRVNQNQKQNLAILGLVYGLSALLGIIIDLIV